MRILFSPDNSGELKSVYKQAFRDAKEVYIASAYLTEWDPAIELNKNCQKITFLVGIDFGLTRKVALRNVLNWLPNTGFTNFSAVYKPNGNFHPKLIAWEAANGRKFCLIGSSNLSKAAFSTNCEVNVRIDLSDTMYFEIVHWLEGFAKESVPITKDWIEYHYKEAILKGKNGGGSKKGIANLELASINFAGVGSLRENVRLRRAKQTAFAEISKPLLRAVRQSASGSMLNEAFWSKFWALWSQHESRFQGSGLQISCKHADWREANSSFLRILNASKQVSVTQLDQFVTKEINALAKAENPSRGAWLSEMLCHYLPESYPLIAQPMYAWLRHIKWRPPGRPGEGQHYIDLARQLRYTVRKQPFGAKNLAELDAVIWGYADKMGLLKKKRKKRLTNRS